VLPRVLKAASGGGTDGLAALAYLNLRGAGFEGLKVLPMLGGLPAEWFDTRGAAEMRRIPDHLTGAAVGLRHDKDGLVLDCYSPTGLLLPAVLAGVLSQGPQPLAHRAGPLESVALAAPSLGILQQTADGKGVKVLALEAGGAVANGGVQQGDRIVAIDGTAVGWIEDLNRELAKHRAGERIELTIRRGEAELSLEVVLGAEMER
jgi:hypothetical protein